MYKPFRSNQGRQSSNRVSQGARFGMDIDSLPQMMDAEHALSVVNYIPTRHGLESRPGIRKVFERAGSYPITFLNEMADGLWIFGYSTKVEAYDTDSDTYTTIKSDYAGTYGFGGDLAGDYMLVCDFVEPIKRISRTLAYDNQTGNFAVGKVLTGATSGATAVILEDSDSGAAGTLTLGSIDGVFIDNETITDSGTGSAKANGTLGFAIAEITGSPICADVKVKGDRAFALRIRGDETAVQYSDSDDGTNPAFGTWSDGTAADEGGSVRWRALGPVRSLCRLGKAFVAFGDDGFVGFSIDTLDSGGTIKKVETIQNYTEDFGGARGAIETPMGIYFFNEAGIRRMVAIGSESIPMSRQEEAVSELFGTEYFKDTDQSNVDIAYEKERRIVLVSVAKGSTANNLVLCVKPEMKNAITEFRGWNIGRFAQGHDGLYGASSVSAKVWRLFDGWEDDGLEIGTEYLQEVNLGTLFHRHSLDGGLYAGGWLMPDETKTISFDVYRNDGRYERGVAEYEWTGEASSSEGAGFGSSSFGSSSFGGGFDTGGMVWCVGGGNPVVSDFSRLRIRVVGGGRKRHILSFISARTRQKGEIIRRNITAK